jgi:hypothetical protein
VVPSLLFVPKHVLKNDTVPPLIWQEPLSPELPLNRNEKLPIVSVTTNFSVPLDMLIPPLRRLLRSYGVPPLQRPPPTLPGHPVALSISKMSACALGEKRQNTANAIAPVVVILIHRFFKVHRLLYVFFPD